MREEKKGTGYCGENHQNQCLKKISKSHQLRNGYRVSDSYLIIKAKNYAKSKKLS